MKKFTNFQSFNSLVRKLGGLILEPNTHGVDVSRLRSLYRFKSEKYAISEGLVNFFLFFFDFMPGYGSQSHS